MNGRWQIPVTIPAPRAGCSLAVVIPARDEAATIVRALAALCDQREASGGAVDPDSYEVIVFANDCRDATARRAREFAQHAEPAIHVIEDSLPPGRAHVGTARAALMDLAARRLRAGGLGAAIATTDADSEVATSWIAQTRRELGAADAVGGRIVIDPHDGALDAATARALARQERYRFAIARLEALRDPLAYDPWPRHGQHFGASFAVRLATYARAGGMPAVERLEDVALYDALLRIDARVRHSLRVRVRTSPRCDPRAGGGFGSHVAKTRHLALRGRSIHVEHPESTIARIEARAALRRWRAAGARPGADADIDAAARTLWTAAPELAAHIGSAEPFGAIFDELEARAEHAGAFARPHVTLEIATARLETYTRSVRGAAPVTAPGEASPERTAPARSA